MNFKCIGVLIAFLGLALSPFTTETTPSLIMLDCSTKNIMTKKAVSFSMVFHSATLVVETSGDRLGKAKFAPSRISGEESFHA